MDKITLKNLKIPGKHGVYDFEKKTDGLFELDIELFCDLSPAGNSDNLDDTIDYGEITAFVTEVFTEKDYKLIESVAERICKQLLESFSINKVCVRIRKPHAPIKANFETVEVELIRGC